MTYEASILAPGEKILGKFRAHALPGIGLYWVALAAAGAAVAAGAIAGSGALGLGVASIFILIWGVKFLDWLNCALVITNRRVIKGSGILAKQTRDSSLDKITDLELSQSVVGRLLDFGTLSVLTANEKAADVFPGLARPKIAKSTLLDAKTSLESGRTGLSGGGAGADEGGDIAAIDRLSRRGLLSDTETKDLLRKVGAGGRGAEGV